MCSARPSSDLLEQHYRDLAGPTGPTGAQGPQGITGPTRRRGGVILVDPDTRQPWMWRDGEVNLPPPRIIPPDPDRSERRRDLRIGIGALLALGAALGWWLWGVAQGALL